MFSAPLLCSYQQSSFLSQCSFAHIMTVALEQRETRLKLCGCLQYVIEVDHSSTVVSSDAAPADVFNHIFKVLLRSFTTSSLDERPKWQICHVPFISIDKFSTFKKHSNKKP